MTREEKQLLIKDLSARLPYGVKFKIKYGFDTLEGMYYDGFINPNNEKYYDIEDIKPYLRLLSSMTEEEKKELLKCTASTIDKVIDFYNSHHFDYRGLIDKGFVLEAPKGLYS